MQRVQLKCVHIYLFNLFKQNGLTTVSLKRLKTVIYIKNYIIIHQSFYKTVIVINSVVNVMCLYKFNHETTLTSLV